MILAEARAEVAEACRLLRDERLTVGTAGNVSVRHGDLVAISPSGVDYDALSAEQVAVHRLDGTPVEGSLQASTELPLHLAVYRDREAGAVVHTHAVASTALSTVVDEVPASHYYTALFGGPVRVARYATYGSDALAAHVIVALEGRTAALMANHGAVCAGPSLAVALDRARYLEYVCEVQLRAMATGLPVRTLPADELARVAASLAAYGKRPERR